MKIKLILNPTAGRRKAKRAIPVIKHIFKDRGADFEMGITQRPGEATDLSREASRRDFRIIVAVGGDGTINEVANGIIGSSSILGVIPLGLGNDFASVINMPSNLKQACRVICDGPTREIDVGRINNRYFVNGVGIGFDAWVARESQRIRWFFLPKLIYLLAVIKMLFRYKPVSIKISLADTMLERKVLLIALGNGKSSGGGFLLTPEAKLDDGLIDACVIDDVARLKLLIDLPKTLKGTHKSLPYVTTFKTKKLTIHSSSLLLAHVDGEILESSDYQIEILPRRLKVIAPRQID